MRGPSPPGELRRMGTDDTCLELATAFEEIVDAHPTGLLLTDHDGVIRYSNRRAASLFGSAPASLVGREVESLLPERFRPQHASSRAEVLNQRVRRTIGKEEPLRGLHSSGREFPAEVTFLPVQVGEGLGIACAIVDCSERARARSALSRSEKQLRGIIDNSTAVIYVKDLEGRYLLVNSQYERLFTVTPEDYLGRTDFDLFPEDMAEAFRANDARVARTGQTLKIDEIAPHEDGPHTYLSIKFPLRDDEGNIYAVAGISTDITDRVRAEAAARELRNRLELILNSINDGIVGLDTQGRVTFANPTAERLLQSDVADMAELLPSVATDVATRPVDLADKAQIRPTMCEMKLRRSDGRPLPAEFQVHPVVEQGRHEGAVMTIRDVSDRKRREDIERELQSARAVQQILYPRSWPNCPGFDIAGHVYPADSMCGDYLDFIQVNPQEICVAVGDVSGHGFGPSLQMVETRACLRALLKTGHALDDAVTRLNSLLIDDIPPESFITLFAASIALETRSVTYVSAGHAGWLFRQGQPPRKIIAGGLVLGVDAESEYEQSSQLPLQTGDVLLLPTDGVQETQNVDRQLFGIPQMLETVGGLCDRSAAEIVDELYQATIRFAGLRRQNDDLTIAVVKVL